ncbi:MAG: M15 family metallopeptidase [Candidatus Paceibacterota bacterium]
MVKDFIFTNRYTLTVAILLAAGLVVAVRANMLLQDRYEVLSGEYASSTNRVAFLETELSDERTSHSNTARHLSDTQSILQSLQQNYNLTVADRDRLATSLNQEKEKVQIATEQVSTLTDAVTTLTKLNETDKELLQKYSKVYFLNEHYLPAELTVIEPHYTYDETTEYKIHGNVWPYLKSMQDTAEAEGIALWVRSAYRSFEYQAELKAQYQVNFGSGANAFSADQGYSEHQLGTAVDFTTRGIGGGLSGFGNTPAYTWLVRNAHRFGFTLSYPENNQYYVFEPWHWRFVGIDLATHLYETGKHFYDLDQRTIDTYLLTIFD